MRPDALSRDVGSAETVGLRAGKAEAAISLRGAELRRWSVAGRELLWSPDPIVWDATAPILFPIVGWTRGGVIRVDGREYRLGVHGFAAERSFTVQSQSKDELILRDQADAETRGRFPFDYQLETAYRLSDEGLSCSVAVTNVGTEIMPYAMGLHPGFRWPAGSGRITFDCAEAADVPVITKDGLFAQGRRPVPLAKNVLNLSRGLLAEEALCFLDIRSRGLTFEAEGFGRLRIDLDDFPHVALWSRPPAPFLCIEAWTGHGDPEGFAGELSEKPSMRLLKAGSTARHAVRWTFSP